MTSADLATRPRLLELFTEVAERRGLLLSELCGRDRSQGITAGRHECWWHLRGLEWSNGDIAKLWAVHTTTVRKALEGYDDG